MILNKLVRRFKSASLDRQTLLEIGFIPFIVAKQEMGWVHQSVFEILGNWPAIFSIDKNSVTLSSAIQSTALRTQFMQRIATLLAEHDCIPPLQGRMIPVGGDIDVPLFNVDCAAAAFFGLEIPVGYLAATSASYEGPMIWLKKYNGRNGPYFDMVVQEVVTKERDLPTIFNDACMSIGITTGMAQPTGIVKTCRVAPEGLIRCQMHSFEIEVSDDVKLSKQNHPDQYMRISLQEARDLLVNGDKIGLEGSLVLAELLRRYGWIKRLPNGLWLST